MCKTFSHLMGINFVNKNNTSQIKSLNLEHLFNKSCVQINHHLLCINEGMKYDSK
jgi:hypothetical protein